MAKRAIVVGASSHLGNAVCRELERRGARVGGTYLGGESRLVSVAAARRLDLTDADAIGPTLGALAGELGGADVLVHCAAVAEWTPLAEVDAARFSRMLAVNVTSALLCAKAFAALGGEAPRSLVLIGSIDGAKSVPTSVPYASSKGALVAMARALAKELSPHVLVNVVAPGVLGSGITAMVPEDVKAEYLKHSAQKRFGTHEEVARTIAWLSLSNTYVTGQTMVLDGGL